MRSINKHIVTKAVVILALLLGPALAALSYAPAVTYAAASGAASLCPDGKTTVPQGKESTCPGAATTDSAATTGGNCSNVNTGSCDLLDKYINPFIRFLSAVLGIGAAISLAIGGVQYGSSAGDPQKVTAAKMRIRNTIIALITFIFLFSLLNFLIPGGIL